MILSSNYFLSQRFFFYHILKDKVCDDISEIIIDLLVPQSQSKIKLCNEISKVAPKIVTIPQEKNKKNTRIKGYYNDLHFDYPRYRYLYPKIITRVRGENSKLTRDWNNLLFFLLFFRKNDISIPSSIFSSQKNLKINLQRIWNNQLLI